MSFPVLKSAESVVTALLSKPVTPERVRKLFRGHPQDGKVRLGKPIEAKTQHLHTPEDVRSILNLLQKHPQAYELVLAAAIRARLRPV